MTVKQTQFSLSFLYSFKCSSSRLERSFSTIIKGQNVRFKKTGYELQIFITEDNMDGLKITSINLQYELTIITTRTVRL